MTIDFGLFLALNTRQSPCVFEVPEATHEAMLGSEGVAGRNERKRFSLMRETLKFLFYKKQTKKK